MRRRTTVDSDGRTLAVALAIAGALVPGTAAARFEPPSRPASHEDAAAEPSEPPTETPASEPAAADPRAEAAAAFLEGSKYYELGQFSKAVERFERAWDLSREPLLLFNLGRTHYEWFKVDGDIDHLRRAKMFYQNYDKRMAGAEGYNADEITAIMRTLDLEIEKAQSQQEGKVDRELAAREEAERRRALIEHEKRIIRTFNASGDTLIVVGCLTLAMGLGGILGRTANKIVLDNSSGGGRTPNLSSVEEDKKHRHGYLVGGQLAFSGFIISGILLPVGIALRVVGEVRERRALDSSAKTPKPSARLKLDVDASGVRVRF
jgi:tetratricopeptide (TPR) repeat protein